MEAEVVDRIVGIRTWDDRTLRIYRRTGGTIVAASVPFTPWLAIADPSLIDVAGSAVSSTSLSGDDPLRTVLRFDRWPQAWDTIQKILVTESERRRQRVSSYLDLPGLLFLSDPAEQWLAASNATFFDGLTAADLVRMQLAVETAAPPGRPSRSDRSQDRILTIAATLSDGRKSSFRIKKHDEATLLAEFHAWFVAADPDVVEGIDLLSTTLPYIAERCALHGIEPSFGREGAMLRVSSTPVGKGPWELPGRMTFDPAESLRHAGPTIQAIVSEARPARTKAPAPSASTPARRCQEARRWSDPWWFALLPLMASVPLPPDRFMRSGPGHWLEAWLVRECLRQARAIPSSGHSATALPEFAPAGASGRFAPAAELVLVPSKAAAWRQLSETQAALLPPWIRGIRDRWEPTVDGPASGKDRTLAIALLTGLTDAVRARSSRLHDTSVAERLDRAIAQTAATVAATLRRQNVEVIQEVGERLYVEYPDNIADDERRRLFWTKVNVSMPEGLRAVPLRMFDAIVSVAPRIMHGLSGPSVTQLPRPHSYRSPEPFIREYHARAIGLILRCQWNQLHQLTSETIRRIRNRAWHISEFCRRDTLTGSLDEYVREREGRRRNPSAPYEALLRAHGATAPAGDAGPNTPQSRRHLHEAGSTVVYYIAGNRRDLSMADMSRLAEYWDPSAPDENTDHYLDRLRQSLERYRPLFSERDFSSVFEEESLFSFNDDDIGLVRRSLAGSLNNDRAAGPGLGIWLDLPGRPT
ncbi:MAG: hypothetical protein MUE68_01545 [Bacteroidetes bacterium]|nr:hypothetical protein [Bacteroidota bacterium]